MHGRSGVIKVYITIQVIIISFDHYDFVLSLIYFDQIDNRERKRGELTVATACVKLAQVYIRMKLHNARM